MKLLHALGAVVLPLPGQIDFGVKAGVPFTNITETISTGHDLRLNVPSRWTVGPMVELDLPFGLASN